MNNQSPELAAVRVNRQSVGDYLVLGEGLRSERNREVLSQYLERIEFTSDYLTTDADRDAFQSWVQRTLAPTAKRLDLDGGGRGCGCGHRYSHMPPLSRRGNQPQVHRAWYSDRGGPRRVGFPDCALSNGVQEQVARLIREAARYANCKLPQDECRSYNKPQS